jgi:hypothetical protein
LGKGAVTRRVRILSFTAPAIWYAFYLVAVAIAQDGLGWSIHVVLGAPVIDGIVGLVMSVLIFPARNRTP